MLLTFSFLLFLFFFFSSSYNTRDVGDSPTDQVQEDMDSEVYPSEDGRY